jgi:predicted transcriptional regulator
MLINEAVRKYFMVYKKSYFSVIQGNKIVGVIHMNDIKKIPNEQREEYIVGYAMKKASGFPTIDERESGDEVMKKLARVKEKPQLVVVRGNNNDYVLGFIGEDDLVSTIKFCQFNPEKC